MQEFAGRTDCVQRNAGVSAPLSCRKPYPQAYFNLHLNSMRAENRKLAIKIIVGCDAMAGPCELSGSCHCSWLLLKVKFSSKTEHE